MNLSLVRWRALVVSVPSVMAIFLAPGQIQGTNGTDHFQHISDTNGKTLMNVHSILQDEHGFFWLGSSEGLVRYDGYTFKDYKKIPDDPNSLSHNEINVIYMDKAGVLWIGTERGGHNRFNRNYSSFTRYMHEAGRYTYFNLDLPVDNGWEVK